MRSFLAVTLLIGLPLLVGALATQLASPISGLSHTEAECLGLLQFHDDQLVCRGSGSDWRLYPNVGTDIQPWIFLLVVVVLVLAVLAWLDSRTRDSSPSRAIEDKFSGGDPLAGAEASDQPMDPITDEVSREDVLERQDSTPRIENAPFRSARERLMELEDLHAGGFVSESEYTKKRNDILRDV